MDGWTDEWIDGWIDGWMNGQMEVCEEITQKEEDSGIESENLNKEWTRKQEEKKRIAEKKWISNNQIDE